MAVEFGFFLGLFGGFVFLVAVVAEFEDFDEEEGHVGGSSCGYGLLDLMKDSE